MNADKDIVLRAILRRIASDREVRISEPAPPRPAAEIVAALISGFSRAEEGKDKSLDFVGHARRGFLHIGTWVLDATAKETEEIFRYLLEANEVLGFTRIRLLGCLTGGTSQGDKVVQSLQKLAGLAKPRVTIYGSHQFLHASDFEKTGLGETASNDLKPVEALETPSDVDVALAQWWSKLPPIDQGLLNLYKILGRERLGSSTAPLRKESIRSMYAANALYGNLVPLTITNSPIPAFSDLWDGIPRRVEGLLELPLGEVAARLGDTRFFHRLSVLCDGRLARIYPTGEAHGITFRVRKEQQQALLALASK